MHNVPGVKLKYGFGFNSITFLTTAHEMSDLSKCGVSGFRHNDGFDDKILVVGELCGLYLARPTVV